MDGLIAHGMVRAIIAPAVVLVLWTLFMLVWVGVARAPALGNFNGLATIRPGGRGQDLEPLLPAVANWKSHNYTHLLEQPTMFYAIVVMLALLGAGHIDVALAWGYVILRVIHSLWQALVNRIPLRFTLFMASTACLLALSMHAAMMCFAPSFG